MEIALEEKIRRLSPERFFGKVLVDWSEDIIRLVEGRRVLDIGCGYGYLVNALTKKGFLAEGIDISQEAIATGRKTFGGIKISVADAYRLPFSDGAFDTVIFHDAMHHLDFERAIREADRVGRGCLIVFDPNPNFMVKFCRRCVRHQDEEAPYREVIDALDKCGYSVNFFKLRDVIAMPLSGGFVARTLCPDIPFLHRLLIKIDHLLCAILRFLFLGRFFCWRYLIQAKRGKR